jgi:hypothetical protein
MGPAVTGIDGDDIGRHVVLGIIGLTAQCGD